MLLEMAGASVLSDHVPALEARPVGEPGRLQPPVL